MKRCGSTPDTGSSIAKRMGPAGIFMVLAGLVLTVAWIVRSGGATDASVANAPVAPTLSVPTLAADRATLPSSGDSPRSSAEERTTDAHFLDPDDADGSTPLLDEGDFFARFRSLSSAMLTAEAERVLAGDSTRAERVALLRALLDREHPGTLEAFEACMEATPAPGAPGLESLPASLVHLLRQRARHEPLARQILEAITWSSRVPPDLRARAAAMAVAYADEADLRRMQDAILLEHEPTVRAALSAGLRAHRGVLFAIWLDERLAHPEPDRLPEEPTLE